MERWPLIIAALAAFLNACATPTRPSENFSLTVIEVNNTPTQTDDYVGTSTRVPVRVRIANSAVVDTDRDITVRNMDESSGGQLRFSSTSTGSLANFVNLTLPETGSWVNFFIVGLAGSTSSRDKDAVIEIIERRPTNDGITLGRWGVQVQNAASGTPLSSTDAIVTIAAGDPADDYLAWSPRVGRVRVPSAPNANIVLANYAQATGRMLFANRPTSSSPPPTPAGMSSTLTLTTDASGNADFFVAGQFGQPSERDKDAVIEVRQGTTPIARHGAMVRVRKNAEALTADERNRLVAAFSRLRDPVANYEDFQTVHSTIGCQGHSFNSCAGVQDAFLPWHRIFILRLERELQALDPSVALHYWRFDDPAPTVFSAAFMGGPPNASGNATFDASNPLSSWSASGLSGLRRLPDFAPAEDPSALAAGCSSVRTESQTLGLGTTYSNFALSMEGNPHGRAHIRGGGTNHASCASPFAFGWLYDPTISVRDPLFFMLHSNVDRLWAAWQQANNRFTPTAAATYTSQGAGTTGHNLLDEMAPWNVTGSPGGAFPQTPGRFLAPPLRPMPLNAINYHRTHYLLDGTIHQHSIGLGFAYDDVAY